MEKDIRYVRSAIEDLAFARRSSREWKRTNKFNLCKFGISDKIEFDMLQKRAQLIFYTAWEIANRDDRLVIDKN